VDAAVAWPPPEAAPAGEAASGKAASGEAAGREAAGKDAPAAATPVTETGKAAPEAGPGDSGVMTAPDAKPVAKPAAGSDAEIPAAEPKEEMALSNSTLHWLEDGDQAVPGRLTEPGSMPSYDPRAPVPGRKRAVLVVGLTGLAAVIVAGSFYMKAQQRRAAEPAPAATIEPARDLTNRAEAALAANKIDEALELANLALVADQRFADAHFVVATCKQARNQPTEARDAYRKYLDLAPFGTHAAVARAALVSLSP
jgi:tetratricopeptide (TPR) repeat protein